MALLLLERCCRCCYCPQSRGRLPGPGRRRVPRLLLQLEERTWLARPAGRARGETEGANESPSRAPTTRATAADDDGDKRPRGSSCSRCACSRSTLYSTTAAPAPPPSSFQACEQECLLPFAGARDGQGCCLLPLQAQRKKMRSLFNAQKKRRKKNGSERESPVSKKKGGGEGRENQNSLSLPFSRFELLCVSGPCLAPALPVRHRWLGASPLFLLLHLHLLLLGEGEEEAKTSDRRRRRLRQCPLPPPPPPRQPPAIPIRSAQRKPLVPRRWSQTR